jgi:hypothetical protein
MSPDVPDIEGASIWSAAISTKERTANPKPAITAKIFVFFII